MKCSCDDEMTAALAVVAAHPADGMGHEPGVAPIEEARLERPVEDALAALMPKNAPGQLLPEERSHWHAREAVAAGRDPLSMRDVLTGMIKAHEIQGCIALENSFNKVGLDHVILVKVASTAVVAQMMGFPENWLEI